MLGDARDDGTSPQSVVYFELKEFIGFGYFLALQNFSHANVELGEVVELDRRSDRFGYLVGFFVGDFGILQFFDLRFDDAVVDFLEEKFGGSQLSAGFENIGVSQHIPFGNGHAQHRAYFLSGERQERFKGDSQIGRDLQGEIEDCRDAVHIAFGQFPRFGVGQIFITDTGEIHRLFQCIAETVVFDTAFESAFDVRKFS